MYGDEGDEELSSESLSDIEKQAEERALTLSSDIGTSGLLTFLQACPEYMQLRVDPKYINADWEANKPIGYEPLEPFDFWAGPEVPLPYHTIVVGRGGSWWYSTYSHYYGEPFNDEQLCGDLEDFFSASESPHRVFACQDDWKSGVWYLYSAADFMTRPEPMRSCTLLLGEYNTIGGHNTTALDVQIRDPGRSPSPVPSPSESEPEPEPDIRVELRTGVARKLEGTFCCPSFCSPKLGDWDVYWSFKTECDEKSDHWRCSLWSGNLVRLSGLDRCVVLVRILGGSKKGGATGRTQACYMCLLYDTTISSASDHTPRKSPSPWMYATMPNVQNTYGFVPKPTLRQIELELESFTPATVSGAIQQAGKFTDPCNKPCKKQKK